MGVVIGGVRLEAQAGSFPALAECFCQHRSIKRSVEEASIKAVASLKGLGRPLYAGFRKTRRLDGGFSSPTGLKALDRAAGPVGFQRAAGQANGDPDRICYCL